MEYLAKALVDHPDEVNVTQVEGDKSIILELRAEPSDKGTDARRRPSHTHDCKGRSTG